MASVPRQAQARTNTVKAATPLNMHMDDEGDNNESEGDTTGMNETLTTKAGSKVLSNIACLPPRLKPLQSAKEIRPHQPLIWTTPAMSTSTMKAMPVLEPFHQT